jgi:hypothetical protein
MSKKVTADVMYAIFPEAKELIDFLDWRKSIDYYITETVWEDKHTIIYDIYVLDFGRERTFERIEVTLTAMLDKKYYNLVIGNERESLEYNDISGIIEKVKSLIPIGGYEKSMVSQLNKKSDIDFNVAVEVLGGYLKAALWASTDDNGEPLDRNYHTGDIDASSRNKAINDIENFIAVVDRKIGINNIQLNSKFGTDFWLTRNRHGAGFWDGGYGTYGKILTDLAQKFSEINAYVGDDFNIYID